MKVEYTRENLAKLIDLVREAEYSDDLPIYSWARAAKVLDKVADDRLELLRRLDRVISNMGNPVIDSLWDNHTELMNELARELAEE